MASLAAALRYALVVSSDTWNPAQYERFKAERAQPFYDLLELVELPRASDQQGRVYRAADLGCGTGELTAALHNRLCVGGAAVSTLGLDNSAAMLERSRSFAAPGLHFEQGDIAQFSERHAQAASHGAAARFDLLFSNAALQWLEEHERLFAQLSAALAGGGQLAVQMPANQDHPAYALAGEVAGEPRFAALLAGYKRESPLLLPEQYALLLGRVGFARQQVQLRVYLHRLSDRGELLEWLKGSLLTDYERRLSAADYQAFIVRYSELLAQRLQDERPYLFTFKRLLIWGRK